MSIPPQHPEDFASRYEAAAARLLSDIERACAGAEDWPRGVRAAVAAALARLSEEPELGPLLLFEPYDADVGAQRRHEATLSHLADLLHAGREHAREATMPDAVEEGLVGAITFIAGRPLRAGEPDLLPAIGPELTALILTPYLGRREAERIAFDRP